MRQKIIAGAIALTLTTFAAIGAFASQDGVSFKSLLSGGVLGSATTPTDTATVTTTATTTDTATATVTGTITATDTSTATATPDANATPTVTGTPTGNDDHESDDQHEGGIKGIPTFNPEHPEATGTCEKGEATVKTTPGGTQVNVPCQAAGGKDHGDGNHGDSHRDDQGDGQGNGDGSLPTNTPTPAATPTP